MNISHQKTLRAGIALAFAAALLSAGAPFALAQGPAAGAGSEARTSAEAARESARAAAEAKTVARLKDRASAEIARRTEALQRLSTRIQDFKNISSSDKAALAGNIESQLQELATLKTTIDADTSTTTLRTDVESITKSYRTYALVIPQATVMAAIDRVNTLAAQMSQISDKLGARLAQATTTTPRLSAAQTALADLRAKVADAQTQAKNALAAVSGLQPDNGDKTVMQSNITALKGARSMIQAAHKDLETARKDIPTILRGLPKEVRAEVRTGTAVQGATSTATGTPSGTQ